MRNTILAISLTVASGVAMPAFADWQYRSENDEMRNVVNRWAALPSDNSADTGAYRPKQATLSIILRDMPKTNGRSAILNLSSGQLDCSYQGCKIPIKFDDSAIVTFNATRASGGDNSIIFLQDQASFLKRLRTAKLVRIEVPVWRKGALQFRFSPQNLDWK